MKKKFKIVVAIWVILIISIITISTSIVMKGSKEKEYHSGNFYYNLIMRQPNKYKGYALEFTGTVLQVIEEKGSTSILLNNSGDIICCDIPKKLIKDYRILKEDNLRIYGVFKKLYNYETVEGSGNTIPLIKVDNFNIVSKKNSYTSNENYNNSTDEATDDESYEEDDDEEIDNTYGVDDLSSSYELIGKDKIIRSSNANIRSGPGLSYQVIDSLSKGDTVHINRTKYADERIWCNIGDGWISINTINGVINDTKKVEDTDTSDDLSSSYELIGQNKIVRSSNANIRSGPGFSYPIVDSLSKGDSVHISRTKYADERIWCNIGNGWISINTINGVINDTKKADNINKANDISYYYGLIGQYIYISSSNANVRSGPGFSYPIIDSLSKRDLVCIDDIREADERIWCSIGEGWISINTINGSIN